MERGRAITQLGLIFHDPPWKPWVIRGWRNRSDSEQKALALNEIVSQLSKSNTLAGKVAGEAKHLLDTICRDKKGIHELHGLYILALLAKAAKADDNPRAHAVAWEALKETCEGKKAIREADQVSAGLDRLLLLKVQQAVTEPGHGTAEPVYGGRPVLKNPFEPQLKLYLLTDMGLVEKVVVEFLANYVDRVIKVWSYCKNEKVVSNEECYSMMIHGAFAALEPTWYEAARTHDMAPPADTRMPDHTLFDHLNAALGVSNVLGAGCIARVELAAVQTWISSSRRFRDLWASSFLISALAYAAVRDLIWENGPGTSLQPPVRGNPFYYATLAAKAESRGVSEASETIRELARLAIGLELEKALQYPATPEGYTLLLPPKACSQLSTSVRDSLKNAWSRILEAALDVYGPPLFREVYNLPPPLPLRVWKVSMEELETNAHEFMNKINKEFTKALNTFSQTNTVSIHLDEQDLPILKLVLALPKLMDMKRRLGGVKLSFLSSAEVIDYMDKAGLLLRRGASGVDHDYDTPNTTTGRLTGSQILCVSCGRLPAIYRGGESARTRRILRGDRLCPYCAVKRALSEKYRPESGKEKDGASAEKNVLSTVIATVTGLEIREWQSVIKSIGSVDSYTTYTGLTLTPTVERISEILAENTELRTYIAEFIEQVEEDIGGVFPEAVLSPRDISRVYSNCKTLNRDSEELCLKLYTHVLEASVDGTYRERLLAIAEKHGKEPVNPLKDVLRELIKISTNGPEAEEWRAIVGEIHGFYAMVKGDGDYMGKGILQGRFPRQLHTSPQSYALSLINLEDTDRGKKASRLFARLYEAFIKAYEETVKPGSSEDRLITVRAPSPSYHYTVSRALQAIAWREAELADRLGGTVVYSGGDDVLAVIKPRSLISAKNPEVRYDLLEFLDSSRKLYWGELGDVPPGFNSVGKEGYMIVPAIRGHGKSYGVVLAKAKENLRRVLEAVRFFEEAKDELKWREPCSGEVCRSKDIAVMGVLHGTPKIGEAAKLPLSPKNGIIQPLISAKSVLSELGRLYSRNLPSDYLSVKENVLRKQTSPGLGGVIEAAAEIGSVSAVRRLIEMLGRRNAYKETGSENAAKSLVGALDSLVGMKVCFPGCDECIEQYSVLGEVMKAVRELMRS